MSAHKKLSVTEALEYIAFAVWQKDVPDDFAGEITCELNEDGSVDVYAVDPEFEEVPMLN